jgi:hypothetical protein
MEIFPHSSICLSIVPREQHTYSLQQRCYFSYSFIYICIYILLETTGLRYVKIITYRGTSSCNTPWLPCTNLCTL